MLVENLVKIGLTDKEAKMYLALLELSEASIQDISKKSGIKRTTAYDILETLKQKGFIGTTTQKKRKLYFAQNPKKLELDLEEKKAVVNSIMPDLLAITNQLEKKPGIKYFQGIEGIKEIYKDTLNYKDSEILDWWPQKSDYGQLSEDFFYGFYMPQRLKRKIWMRAIAPDSDDTRRHFKENDKFLRKMKIVKYTSSPNVDITIYGKNKVAILSIEEKFGLIIESNEINNTLRSIFELQWASLPE